MIRFLKALVVLVLATSTSAWAQYYPSYYGAIAIDQNTGASGYSWDHGTRYAAESAALGSCQGNCFIAVWFSNTCGAVAWSNSGAYGWAHNTYSRLAESNALASCQANGNNCQIIASLCTTRYQ